MKKLTGWVGLMFEQPIAREASFDLDLRPSRGEVNCTRRGTFEKVDGSWHSWEIRLLPMGSDNFLIVLFWFGGRHPPGGPGKW